MIDTKVLAEPRENVHLVYAGNLDSDESRAVSDFVTSEGKFDLKRIEVVEHNIIVLLVKSVNPISYNDREKLILGLKDRVRLGKVYYCITNLNCDKVLIADSDEKFFFTGQSLLKDFVHYNDKSLADDSIYKRDVIVPYLRAKYGNPELTEEQLLNIGIISDINIETNMDFINDLISPCKHKDKSRESREDKTFDDNRLFEDEKRYDDIKKTAYEYFNLSYIDSLKDELKKKIEKFLQKSTDLKSAQEQDLFCIDLCIEGFFSGKKYDITLDDILSFSYSAYPEIDKARNDFIIGNIGTEELGNISEKAMNKVYLHLVSPNIANSSEIIIPEGVTNMAKIAFRALDTLPSILPHRITSNIRKIVFPSTFEDDLYLDNFSFLEHLECIEVKSDRTISVYFDNSKRFKVAEFKKKLIFAN